MAEDSQEAKTIVQPGSNTEATLRIQAQDLEARGLAESPAHLRICEVLARNGLQNKGKEGNLS